MRSTRPRDELSLSDFSDIMRILVTGCGGFLGRAIARQLVARGDEVVAFVRRDSVPLRDLGIQLRLGDIRDAAAVEQACANIDAVIHTAAIAGVWGAWQEFYSINTQGTLNWLNACQRCHIRWFVHCSSPSVTFDGSDQKNTDETAPYPKRWLAHYPHTKALAEQAVLAAHRPGRLHTIALRPHLIWGPEDPHLIPRLVARARAGRLAIIGNGQNRMDTVHVENAALAHLLALDAIQRGPEAGGRSYFITQDEPVNCWDFIRRLLAAKGAPLPTKRVPLAIAYSLGAMLELLYGALRRKAEPPMTRFVALQLARDHWFNLEAARTMLHYQPRITTEAGIAALAREA